MRDVRCIDIDHDQIECQSVFAFQPGKPSGTIAQQHHEFHRSFCTDAAVQALWLQLAGDAGSSQGREIYIVKIFEAHACMRV